MGDFAEGDMVFELGNVISQWEVLCDGGSGEPCNGFMLDINMDKCHFEVSMEGHPGSECGVRECKGFLGEGGCPDHS